MAADLKNVNKIEFNFCSLSENLINSVLSEQPLDNTFIIFPSESSKRTAIREFQKKWQFENTLLLTMEEFKEQLFLASGPLLKEEKRTLAFYNSLTKEIKSFFKIHNYFQSIELAHHFFDLFGEFNEELVNEHINSDRFVSLDNEMIEWQTNTYQRLLEIKQNYQSLIESKGFSDNIFLYKPNKLVLDNCREQKRFVFVNQFYYTKLEKWIIQKLVEQDKNVVIYYQMPSSLVEKSSLDIKDFKLDDFTDNRVERINVTEAHNDFATMIGLMETLEQDSIQTIVDASGSMSTYERFLDFSKFNINGSQSFSNTSIYRFFAIIHNLVDSLVFEPNREKILLPVQNVLDAVLSEDFFFYGIAGKSHEDKVSAREVTLDYLYSLIDFDYKYIDLDLGFFKVVRSKPGSEYIIAIIQFLQQLLRIRSIQGLADLLDTENGIEIIKIITRQEQHYSDIYDSFYQMLADFLTIEHIGLVDNWSDYFSSPSSPLRNVKVASGILKLFLDYMRPKSIRYSYELNGSGRIEKTGLLDTRNIQYNRIAVLNVIEGQLPRARQTPFLFTEKQRQLLGLKTYEDVRRREKYYFFRLLLNSSVVTLFTQKNIEHNVEASSFLEEIKLFFPSDKIKTVEMNTVNYGGIYQEFFKSNKTYHVDKEKAKSPSFYQLPLEKETDFVNGQLELTYYSLKDLQTNPFVYFIHHIARIDERICTVPMDFTHKLIGIIAHDIISETWNILDQESAGPLFGYDFSAIDSKIIEKANRNILQKREDYYYRTPHNFTYVYFDQIVLPTISQGVSSFFTFLKEIDLSDKPILVIPEREYATKEERAFKSLLTKKENPLELNIGIRGRADLRIEVSDERRYLVFDYKTGGYSKEQLILYELFYYVLENSQAAENVSSYFYQIFKMEKKELRDYYRYGRNKGLTKIEILDEFKQTVVETLESLNEKGFALPENKTHLKYLPEITRKDLFLASRVLTA